jgi:hypothetical protein
MIKRPVADCSTFNLFYILGTTNKCPINIKSYQKDFSVAAVSQRKSPRRSGDANISFIFFDWKVILKKSASARLQARGRNVGVGDFYQGLTRLATSINAVGEH